MLIYPPQIRVVSFSIRTDFKMVGKHETEEECRFGKFMTTSYSCISWMQCQPKDEPKRELDEIVIRDFRAEFGNLPENTSGLPMNIDMSSNFMSDCRR